MRNVVEITQLCKNYGPIEALRGISFSLAPGEVLGFLGHNGAGKTTTIRLILGLLRPDAGSVRLFGEDPYPDDQRRQALRRRLGVILEEDRLYHYMTGEENLEFWAGLHGLRRREASRRISEVLQLVGIGDRARTLVGTYSKGMRRRLAIARALVNRPEMLIMDEPTVGLDPVARVQIRAILGNLVNSEGMTVFLTSHDLAEVEKICQRVAILDHGRIILSGSMEELRQGQGSRLVISLIPQNGCLLPDSLLQELEDLPFVLRADVHGDELCLTLEEGDHNAEIIELLVHNNARVSQVRPAKLSLEDLYLETVHLHEPPATS